MRTIETNAIVEADHKVILTLPDDIPPGQHRIILVIDIPAESSSFSLPVLDLGSWPDNFSASREAIYD